MLRYYQMSLHDTSGVRLSSLMAWDATPVCHADALANNSRGYQLQV